MVPIPEASVPVRGSGCLEADRTTCRNAPRAPGGQSRLWASSRLRHMLCVDSFQLRPSKHKYSQVFNVYHCYYGVGHDEIPVDNISSNLGL